MSGMNGAKSSLIVDRDGKSKEKDLLVVCFGEMLIDFVPTVGGVSLAEAPGGAPVNVAVGITRLGGSTTFVGDDEFGHMVSDILKQNNVDNSGVCLDYKALTALAFVSPRADGELSLCFSALQVKICFCAYVFHSGSVSLIEEPCRSTQLAAIKIAKKAGCILSYDPNLRLARWPLPAASKKEIISN
ncbi:hypothetical protein C5167_044415 [Papaver somniferum]|uniref:Carbohydrate kinase PfkB domain-containing protein n=1 Tax=Papaver somniferum TaxID=3469 RepID=A0A4Y7LC29_PAPSO|nr:hypothetical protein C5167_044415 [Papaver somniferum]